MVLTQTALDSFAMANGFGKTTKSMSEAEKVALRYAFVQDKLSFAAGDFARTSNSWANQTRILSLQFDSLKATIGQGLINAFTPIIKVVNTLIERLQVFASAFRTLTEKVFGNAGGDSGMSNVAADAGEAAAGLGEMDSAAKKAKKSLGKIDELNVISQGDASGGSSNTGTGIDLGAVDTFSSSAEAAAKTLDSKINSSLQGVLEKVKEINGIFVGSFLKKIEKSDFSGITGSFDGIKKSISEIFSSDGVKTGAEGVIKTIASTLGSGLGNVIVIGTNLATNLFGGVNSYLDENKEFISSKIASIFNNASESISLAGKVSDIFAEISDVLKGNSAKSITKNIIKIFSNSFLNAVDIAGKFGNDLLKLIITPVEKNKDKIKTAIEKTLSPISKVIDKIADAVNKTWDKIQVTYDNHIAPMFQSFSDGITEILETLLDGYNNHIAPVLDKLAEKFKTVWDGHIQPAIDKGVELIGYLADSIKQIWEQTMQPFLDWCAANIMPVLGDIIDAVGTLFMDLFAVIGDVASDIMDALKGVIDFITGVFTGDWGKAWNGIKEFFEGIWNGIVDFLTGIWSSIKSYLETQLENIWETIKKAFDPVTGWFKEKFDTAVKNIKDAFSNIGAWFSERFNDVKNVFAKVPTWFKEKFSDAWANIKSAFSLDNAKSFFNGIWEGVKSPFKSVASWFEDTFAKAWKKVKDVFSKGGEIFAGIKDGIAETFKSIVNGLIGGINKIIAIPFKEINKMLNTIRSVSVLGIKPFSGLWNENPLAVPEIPKLAQGGYVKANTPQLAMIGDNRHQGEVVAPEDKLTEMALAAVKMAMQEFMATMQSNTSATTNKTPTVIKLYLNGKEFYAVMVQEDKETVKRTGKSEFAY